MPRPPPPSARLQNLLIEFASLKHASPPGLYLTLTRPDPRLWSGILFVRAGPYRGCILRFNISFPVSYPSVLPEVVFPGGGVWHPLVEQGGSGRFSLKCGFPGWGGGVGVLEVLAYVKSVFDDDAVLDGLSEEDAVNTEAWKAWRERGRGGGVWEGRVRELVERGAGKGGDEMIRFLDMDTDTLESVKERLKMAVEEVSSS